jgi:diguanylate cyclase (GGDEF)-like protein
LIVALACAAAPAGAAPKPTPPIGAIGLRLVDMPVTARDDPRAWVAIVDHLAPGTVIRRRVEVSNNTAAPVRVGLYPAAATIANGSFLGSAGTTPNDLSSWTAMSPGSSDVPAGGHAMASVTITVPPDAAPGEQYGVVWAEARSAPLDGSSVVQVNRVGVRLYLSIGPGGPPAANFTIDSLTAGRTPDGRPMVVASVHNTGGRALDMSGTLELAAGPGGLNAGPFPAALGTTLAIGATEPVTIVLDRRIPAGPWDAQIILRSGLLERRAEATITFPSVGMAPSVATTPARLGPPYPAIAGLLALLLLGLAILLVVRRRRRRAAQDELQPQEMSQPLTAPDDERRRPSRTPAARPALRPVTVADIVEAPYHWQLALPGSHDSLTDLANRSLFEEETQFAIDARGGERLCLMLINLDAFNHVNERFGRDGGDALLVTIAERLRRAVRPQDLVARLDSDNFAILFEDVERRDVDSISRRLTKTINEPVPVHGREVLIQASLGAAQAQPTDNAGLLMQHAAAALADAKTPTKSHHQWYAKATAPGAG